ncbi:MAG TPA: DUF99 family protein [Gammaproteobacteria bacterium]|nr:DUF99 family protein [Gammaproteobacteria bacterium]
MTARISHVIGIDDAPFDPAHRGDVLIVGALYSGRCLAGVLSGRVRRDGANATRAIAAMIQASRFRGHLQAVLLQGLTVAGFNVIDLEGLHCALGLPVVAVSRKAPDLAAIRRALLTRVRGGARKWRLVERAGPMERLGGLYVQYRGISRSRVTALLRRFAVHGALPEPLRTAHLIAGGVTQGESRHRA